MLYVYLSSRANPTRPGAEVADMKAAREAVVQAIGSDVIGRTQVTSMFGLVVDTSIDGPGWVVGRIDYEDAVREVDARGLWAY